MTGGSGASNAEDGARTERAATHPLVSVIVPTMRFDRYLDEALDSLLRQTYEPLEIVLVVDGPVARPTDVSVATVADDPRVHRLDLPEHVGTPRALNAGIAASHGEYIARLDADDLADPHRIARQVKRMQDDPRLVCLGTQVELIDPNGVPVGARRGTLSGAGQVRRELVTRNALVHSSVMYRRDALHSVGGYDPVCARMQDYELFLRLALVGEVDNLPEVLGAYRLHPGQVSHSTRAWAPYTAAVLRARRQLAGTEAWRGQWLRDAVWMLAQVARRRTPATGSAAASAPTSTVLPSLQAVRLATLDVLREAIGEGADVALVGIPTHRNAGDTLIYAGERSYLRRLSCRIRYLTDIAHFSPRVLRRRMPSGTIVVHGGGAIGDVWTDLEALTERIARECAGHRVVVMPQSVYFSDHAAAAAADAAFASHPDFTLLVRDRESLQRARRDLPRTRVLFCPDAALGFDVTAPSRPPTTSVLVLARQDRERASDLGSARAVLRADERTTDWTMDPGTFILWRAGRLCARLSEPHHVRGMLYRLSLIGYLLTAHANLRAAVLLLGSARAVVTDRLHAHVLAGLLGRPCAVLDNNYGKVSAAMVATTGRVFSNAKLFDEVSDAIGYARAEADLTPGSASDRVGGTSPC